MPARSFISQKELVLAARALATGQGQKRAAAELGWDPNQMRRCVTRLEAEVRLEGERWWPETKKIALEWLRLRGLCTPTELERAMAMARQHVLDGLDQTITIGTRMLDLGDHAQAERLYRRSLRDDPGNVQLLTALAECLVEAGRPEEALTTLDLAPAPMPEDARPHFVRAIALHRLGRTGDAVVALEVAHRREPDDEYMLVFLGAWRMETDRDRDRNVALLDRAMTILTRKFAGRDEWTDHCREVAETAFFALWDHGYLDEALAVACTAAIHGWKTEEIARAAKVGEAVRASALHRFSILVRARAENRPEHWPDDCMGFDVQVSTPAHSADEARNTALALLRETEQPSVRLELEVQWTTAPTSGAGPWVLIGPRQWIFAAKRTARTPDPEPRTEPDPPLRAPPSRRRTRRHRPPPRRRPGGIHR